MAQKELSIRDYIAILRRRWWVVAMGAVLGAIIGLALASILPKRYKSQTTVLVQQPAAISYLKEGAAADDVNARLASLREQLTSRTRLAAVIQQLNLFPNEVHSVPMPELEDRLHSAVDVAALPAMPGTDERTLPGFTVTVTFDNAALAQQICSSLTSMFMEQDLSHQESQGRETTEFLTQQLATAKANLDAQNAKMTDLQRRNAGSLPDEQQANLSLLMGLNTQLQSASEAYSRAQEDKAFSESLLAQQVAAWKSSQREDDPASLEKKLKSLQDQLAAFQAQYTDSYPDVVRLKNDIAKLQQKQAAGQAADSAPETAAPSSKTEPQQIQQLRAQVRRDDLAVAAAKKQQEEVQSQIRVQESRVQSSPMVAQDFKSVTQDYQSALDSYNDLLKKRQDSAMSAELQQGQGGEQFKVLDPAGLPRKPDFPKRSLFTMGGFGGGIVLAFGVLLLQVQQDTSLHTERDVEVLLQVPVLALVSNFAPGAGKSGSRHAAHTLGIKA